MKRIFISCFFLTSCVSTFSQTNDTDIFSEKNSLQYAAYLEQQGDYLLAAREYERLTYTYSIDSLRTPALRNYYKTKDWQLSLNKAGQLFPDRKLMPLAASIFLQKTYIQLEEYGNMLNGKILCKSLLDLAHGIQIQGYSSINKNDLNGWLSFQSFTEGDSLQWIEMTPVIHLLKNHKEKSPVKALLLSAIIPGIGKIYTGEWKDGLASLVMVGLSGYQSYRGFKKQGVKSAYGYIYAGLTLGFYSGNLYGSWHSAKRQNRLFNQELRKVTKDALLRIF